MEKMAFFEKIYNEDKFELFSDYPKEAPPFLLKKLKGEKDKKKFKKAFTTFISFLNVNLIKLIKEMVISCKDKDKKLFVLKELNKIPNDYIVDIAKHLLKDADYNIRIKAANLLSSIPTKNGVRELISFFIEDNSFVKGDTKWIINRINKKHLSSLVLLCYDSDDYIRQNALWLLGEVDAKFGLSVFLDRLINDSMWNARWYSAKYLGQIGSKVATPYLIFALKDVIPEVRAQAAWALGKIRDKRAVYELLNLTTEYDVDIRENVIWALSRMKDENAIKALLEATDDDIPNIRMYAFEGLGRLGICDDRVVEAFDKALDKNENFFYRDVLEQIFLAGGKIASPQLYKPFKKVADKVPQKLKPLYTSLMKKISPGQKPA